MHFTPRHGEFAKRLEKAMQHKHCTITDIQHSLGVTYEMARRYTLGTALPRDEKMRSLAILLGVTPAWLHFGDSATSVVLPADSSESMTDDIAKQLAPSVTLKRRINLQALVNKLDNGNESLFSIRVARQNSQVNDMLSGRKSFGEKVALSFEMMLNLPVLWLDQTHPHKDLEAIATSLYLEKSEMAKYQSACHSTVAGHLPQTQSEKLAQLTIRLAALESDQLLTPAMWDALIKLVEVFEQSRVTGSPKNA